jgi:hypothetical protein
LAPTWLAELQALLDPVELGASHGRLGGPGRAFEALVAFKRRLRGSGRERSQDEEGQAAVNEREWLDDHLLRKRSTAATRWIVRHCQTGRLIEQRRANYALWVRLMANVDGAQSLFPVLPDAAVPYVFPLRVKDPEARYQAIRARGVPVFRWDVVWPNVPSIEGDEGKAWQTEVFQLACHQELNESDILAMADAVRDIIELPAVNP